MKPTFHKRLGGVYVWVTREHVAHVRTALRVCVCTHTSVRSDVILELTARQTFFMASDATFYYRSGKDRFM